jgi:PilZ domain
MAEQNDRIHDRTRKRLPCDLYVRGRRHNGVVLDLSPGGLFIQTSARTQPGDAVDLELAIPGERGRIHLKVEVVRKKVVPPQLLTVAHGGVGVRILAAPEAYYVFVSELENSGFEGMSGPRRPAEPPPAPRRPAGSGSPAAPPRPAAQGPAKRAPEAKPEASAGRRFRVRMKQVSGPRSRSLVVSGASEEQARAQALEELGEGWQILQIEAV